MVSDKYVFGMYCLDAESLTLSLEGERVTLPPKAAELLIVLMESAGRVLSREHLLQRLWPDTVVEDGSLTSHVSLLRKALGERGDGHEFIETLPKRGYRFVTSVERIAPLAQAAAAGRAMLLVLPFENFTAGEERYDYFSEGLTEEMITELAPA